MSSSYVAPLVTLPVIIDGKGIYKTRGGEHVEVFAFSVRNDFGCWGTYSCGGMDQWHRSGRLYAGMVSNNDIVERLCYN